VLSAQWNVLRDTNVDIPSRCESESNSGSYCDLFTLLKVLFAYSRGNGWLWQVGWVGVLGMKYDTWICCSGLRAHQTFLEMVTVLAHNQYRCIFSVDEAVQQLCTVARFTFISIINPIVKSLTQGQPSRVESLKMGMIGCPETLVFTAS